MCYYLRRSQQVYDWLKLFVGGGGSSDTVQNVHCKYTASRRPTGPPREEVPKVLGEKYEGQQGYQRTSGQLQLSTILPHMPQVFEESLILFAREC
jgi:hypothetical protein